MQSGPGSGNKFPKKKKVKLVEDYSNNYKDDEVYGDFDNEIMKSSKEKFCMRCSS